MQRNSYTKNLRIDVDTSQLQDLKKQLELLQKDKLEIAAKELIELDASDPQNLERIEELRKAIEQFTDDIEDINTKDIGKEFKKKLKDIGEDIGDAILDFVKDTFSDALERIQDMASYDLGNSIFINQEARQQMFEYGITDPAQNYALTQAMKIIGARSQEDLMYMKEAQRKVFTETIGRATARYNELANKDFFKTMQEFNLEWARFKEELEFSMIEFFMNNKDLIKQVMITGMNFMKQTILLLGKIIDFLNIGERSEFERQAALSSILNQYSTSNTQNNNININNTVNSQDALGSKNMLETASRYTMAQIKNILDLDK